MYFNSVEKIDDHLGIDSNTSFFLKDFVKSHQGVCGNKRVGVSDKRIEDINNIAHF